MRMFDNQLPKQATTNQRKRKIIRKSFKNNNSTLIQTDPVIIMVLPFCFYADYKTKLGDADVHSVLCTLTLSLGNFRYTYVVPSDHFSYFPSLDIRPLFVSLFQLTLLVSYDRFPQILFHFIFFSCHGICYLIPQMSSKI